MRSLIEENIVAYIKSLGVTNIKLNDKVSLIEGGELDILLPNEKIAIEVNGDLWHSTAAIDYKYGVTPQEYHNDKLQQCKDLGITLFFIWEYDWLMEHELFQKLLKRAILSRRFNPNRLQKLIGPRDGDFDLDSVFDAEDGLRPNHLINAVMDSLSDNEADYMNNVVLPAFQKSFYFKLKHPMESLISKKVINPIDAYYFIDPKILEIV